MTFVNNKVILTIYGRTQFLHIITNYLCLPDKKPETRPDVVLLHVFTNDIKTNTPEEKHEVNTYVISSKWSNTKTIVSLTTQRMNHIRLIILPEEDVVMG